MAITAPGMGSFSGTECWRKIFRDSHAQRLRAARSFLFPDQARTGSQKIPAEDLRNAKNKMTVLP